MVPHVFWTSGMGCLASRTPNHFTKKTPSSPPRGASRDLLLHHHRVVKLAFGETPILVHSRDNYRKNNGL